METVSHLNAFVISQCTLNLSSNIIFNIMIHFNIMLLRN